MVSDCDAADFRRRRNAERVRHEAKTVTKPAADVVLQYLSQLADRIDRGIHPVELKRRFADYIQKRVRCPGFHRAEAEKAAAYVLEPAAGEPALPEKVLAKLLEELDAADAKGQVKPYVEDVGGGRGQWFNGVLKLRLRQYGITQRKKGVRRS